MSIVHRPCSPPFPQPRPHFSLSHPSILLTSCPPFSTDAHHLPPTPFQPLLPSNLAHPSHHPPTPTPPTLLRSPPFPPPAHAHATDPSQDSELAVRYNDDAVLESHHLSSAFSCLLQPQHHFAAEWDRDAYMAFRRLVTKLVLMTDLSKHFEFTANLEREGARLRSASVSVTAPGNDGFGMPSSVGGDGGSAALLLTVALKHADLGHSVKPWALHYRWSVKVTMEFFALGDCERAAAVPISPFCDRYKDTDLGRSQCGFLRFVCRPFYEAVAHALPGRFSIDALERLDANLGQWAEYDGACSHAPQ